jgi:hypothetical protein
VIYITSSFEEALESLSENSDEYVIDVYNMGKYSSIHNMDGSSANHLGYLHFDNGLLSYTRIVTRQSETVTDYKFNIKPNPVSFIQNLAKSLSYVYLNNHSDIPADLCREYENLNSQYLKIQEIKGERVFQVDDDVAIWIDMTRNLIVKIRNYVSDKYHTDTGCEPVTQSYGPYD